MPAPHENTNTTIEEICSYYGAILETTDFFAARENNDLIVFNTLTDPQHCCRSKEGREAVHPWWVLV